MSPNSRRIVTGLIVFVVIVGTFYGVLFYYKTEKKEPEPLPLGHPEKFNSKVWMDNKGNQSPDNPRKKMIGDLERNFFKNPLTVKDIETLLGKPDDNFPGEEEGTCYGYGIGQYSETKELAGSLDICFAGSTKLRTFQVNYD